MEQNFVLTGTGDDEEERWLTKKLFEEEEICLALAGEIAKKLIKAKSKMAFGTSKEVSNNLKDAIEVVNELKSFNCISENNKVKLTGNIDKVNSQLKTDTIKAHKLFEELKIGKQLRKIICEKS